jgi:3-oxoacyl-[acyl-carrier protein] reductase
MLGDLAGKVAVVTGGSKGIGAATCRMLAANGVKVAVVSRSQPEIDAIVNELTATGATAFGMSADVTSSAALEHARATIEETLGPVDILIAYAGGFSRLTPIWELAEDEWRDVIERNLTSCFLTMRAFIPGMISRERGSIVLMASVTSRVIDRPLTSPYAAAKGGVLLLMRHAAIELGPYNIRVNAVSPGTVLSERVLSMTDDATRDEVARLSPLGRVGSPEDAAAATLFLVSDSAGWITGATVDVAGGRAMI